MKLKHMIFMAVLALGLLWFAEDTSAYSYASPNVYYNYGSGWGGSSYQTYHASDYYRPQYRGGQFPAVYTSYRPYGYSGSFAKGGSQYVTYKPVTQSWYYGRGNSNSYYDGGWRQSRFYQYYT